MHGYTMEIWADNNNSNQLKLLTKKLKSVS